ncbi:hypothetical protein ACIQPQ_10705 [Streptomyces sp. NPDC091281]|uniref:hypothetical protein n=1 Tax=Streptomyces sp. NPDC091281 TaxID=3365985 RepID=UPI0038031CA4
MHDDHDGQNDTAAAEHLTDQVTLMTTGQIATPRAMGGLRALITDLMAQGRVRLIVDVSATNHVNSILLSVLMDGSRRCADRGGGLVVVDRKERDRLPASVWSADDPLGRCASVPQAVEALARAGRPAPGPR